MRRPAVAWVLAALVVAAVLASAGGCPSRKDVPASCVQAAQPASSAPPVGQPSPYPHAWERRCER